MRDETKVQNKTSKVKHGNKTVLQEIFRNRE